MEAKKELKPKAFKFLQSVAFNKSAADAAHPDYEYFSVDHTGKPKIHTVPGSIQEMPEFAKFVEAGYIVDVDDETLLPQETLVQRGHRLSAKLMAEQATAPADAVAAEAQAPAAEDEVQVSPEVEPQALQPDEDFSQEQEAAPSKPKKKR